MEEAPPAREGNGSLKDSRSESSSSTTPPLSSATSSGLVNGACLGVRSFVKKAWELGVNEPRKVIHCFKVGLALTFVSFFYYYMEPFYEGFGGNSTWVIMTVVVISEYTVVHLIAAESGDRFEPIIVGVSVFLLAPVVLSGSFRSNLLQIHSRDKSSVRLRGNDLHPYVQPSCGVVLSGEGTVRIGASKIVHHPHRSFDLYSYILARLPRLGRRRAPSSRRQ
ncbi:hypothetical protein U1Q18_019825 [Sarracenia purpurea var. burkii]